MNLSSKAAVQIRQWICAEATISLPTSLEFDRDSGRPTLDSSQACLAQVIEPIFEASGTLSLINSSLRPDSLGGEGADIADIARQVAPRVAAISYSAGLVPRLRRFFLNEANNSIGTDLRGTVTFALPLEVLQALGVLQRLGPPRILRNYKAAFKPSTLSWLRKQVTSDPRIRVALSDRLELTGLHLFGRPELLFRAIVRPSAD